MMKHDEKTIKRSWLGGWKGIIILIIFTLFSIKYISRYCQTEGPNAWGPFTGVVLDADTKQPIAGAQVYVHIAIESTWNQFSHRGGDLFSDYGETNSKGRYKMPKRYSLFKSPTRSEYTMHIYKAGYILYPNRFLGPEKIAKLGVPMDKPQVQDNVVYLKKWDDSILTMEDHVRIGKWFLPCGSGRKETWKFCEEAREEIMYDCMGLESNSRGCEKYVNRVIYGHERNK